IDYQNSLNPAQYAAASSTQPAILVVAGAGSGKTRTIVYRLAWLYEQGVDPSQMLLLTFTRKAAREMLNRAHDLLGQELIGIQGGTFHSFAFHILQIWHPEWLGTKSFTLMDASDISDAIKICKSNLKLGSKDHSFPKTQVIAGLLSKARNKELSIKDLLQKDAYHLLEYADDLYEIDREYEKYRREKCLMDYDDLLFELDDLIQKNPKAANYLHSRFSHVLVDEYQDTNLVQARIVRHLALKPNGEKACHIMAVGDEAQSIYAFRGATIRNIIEFPQNFNNTEIIRLEENYRSTQAILNCANILINNAEESFHKTLFTRKKGGAPVSLIFPQDEEQQAKIVVRQIRNLLTKYPPEEIAILFRSGFHSYQVEMALNLEGLPFRKYGGLKYTEAAHVKDCLAFARLILNPLDMPSFSRIATMHPGIGPKTVDKLYGYIREGDSKSLEKAINRNQSLAKDLAFIDELRQQSQEPAVLLTSIITYFEPKLKERYQEDWPSRKQGLDEIVLMAQSYKHLDDFIADLVLETAQDEQKDPKGFLQLSTIHSAKGLEWDAVLVIDLVQDRFPSHHSLSKREEFEEERRLMYVACTRARKELYLYSPSLIFSKQDQNFYRADASPFVEEIQRELNSQYLNVAKSSKVFKYEPEITFDYEESPENEDLASNPKENKGQDKPKEDKEADKTINTKSKKDDLKNSDPAKEEQKVDKTINTKSQTKKDDSKSSAKAKKEPAETKKTTRKKTSQSSPKSAVQTLPKLGHCQHKIFGRGKIVKIIDKDKVEVKFDNYGLKTILTEYLTFED
ncbi:MAG: ATP-dependent helicase, partial [Desulfovibrionaceae bacterium]|nr:ATP-dependent helicase [Desulfovibrionaceae bacterium]